MLQAKNQAGELVTIFHKTRVEIEALRHEETFYCPECNAPLQVKAGHHMIPHFAHRHISPCQMQGESSYHETGKLLLYEWLKQQRIPVSLEHYLPTIQQRPDLLFQVGNKQVAIELQCSKLPTELIVQRTHGYQKQNIQVIWIVGANQLERLSADFVKIPFFARHMIHQFHSRFPLTLYFFSPEQQTITLCQDFIFTNQTTAIGAIHEYHLNQLTVWDLFSQNWLKQQRLYDYWLTKKKHWRNRPAPFYQQKDIQYRKWLYQQGYTIQSLPAFIYLPLKHQYRLIDPLWLWQSQLFFQMLKRNTFVSIENVRHKIKNQLLSSSLFPLIHASEDPFLEYMDILHQIHVVKKRGNRYQLTYHKKPYAHIDAAIEADRNLFTLLANGKRTKATVNNDKA
ncbi:hypothetical protein J416_12262 [Gracilibacillus halophilus YIM-C55.5]|uniref:Competence protein CoiA n=1 Tax=Gracilibacillus halophilus YIM-C55.5 TaxID=1308866 RepID=N4WJ55_9BACI|nr:competence protein CoiA family protein [Gracilibacillus halophilus]ENH96182.1 hypothetical protein J416_12262 [Gracilibacillus halophilus YIM-C55.5]